MEKGTYHNGLTAMPHECELSLYGDTLNIFLKGEQPQLIVWNIRSITSCHYNAGRLLIKHGAGHSETVECGGGAAREIYSAWSGTTAVRKVEGFLVTRKNTAVLVLCGTFLLGAALIYFLLLPWAGEKAASLIPRDVEVQLGQTLSGQFSAAGPVSERTDSLVNEFAAALDLGTDYPLELHVLDSPEINAFALPGGQIFIYAGLLSRMASYEELAALIGHEVSHVDKRHSLKSICRSAASALFVSAMFGDLSGVSSGVIAQADQFRQLQYSRELETEADMAALQLMRQNGVPGRGMLSLLNLLDRESVRMPGMMKYLSTHPETAERIAAVKNRLRDPDQSREHGSLEAIFEALQSEMDEGSAR